MKAFFTTIALSLIFLHASFGQENNFEKGALGFVKALKEKNTDDFVSFYDESVTISDPALNSEDAYSQKQLKEMYGGFFSTSSGFDFKIITTAFDEKNTTLMMLLNVSYPDGENRKYIGWFNFKNGKIVKQIDTSLQIWTVNQMLMTPNDAALSLYVDGLISDYTNIAKELDSKIPVLYMVRDSWFMETEKWLKENVSRAKAVPISSHAMFWEDPKYFNKLLEPFSNYRYQNSRSF